uniref:Dynein heavy chain 10, axonemal n=1 Tax=Cacopsylla melanoneura TaxID=428564 RepID=A0A8D9BVE0_9HEMI
MVIDFSMTPEALEEMFLSRTIEKETDYEEQYERSLAAVRSNKQNYSTFNKHVMTELTRANVWNKNAALDNIKKNLEKCKEAKDKLLEAESIVATLAPMRDLYRPIAKRAVILYQARKDMTKVNHMYQFSLERFIDKVFPNSFDPSQNSIQNRSMQSAQSIDKETEQIEQDQDYELNQRLISVVDSLTVNCYKHICLALFEKHKILFSLQVALRVQLSMDLITRPELDFFMRESNPFPLPEILSYARYEYIRYNKPIGGVAESETSADKSLLVCPAEWLQERWDYLVRLGEMLSDTVLGNLHKRIADQLNEWKQWYDEEQPEIVPIPEPNTTEFHRVLIVRCLRPDRVYASVCHYVTSVLGYQMVDTFLIDYEEVMELTACSVPVLFILQPGCDPEQDLRKLALNHNTTLTSLPMCQGQEQAASSLIKFSALEGHWVLLSNIHLVPSFTRHLESIITTALNDASLSHKSSYSGVDEFCKGNSRCV